MLEGFYSESKSSGLIMTSVIQGMVHAKVTWKNFWLIYLVVPLCVEVRCIQRNLQPFCKLGTRPDKRSPDIISRKVMSPNISE